MKKRKVLIIISIIIFLLSFLYFWYISEIFNTLFIFSLGVFIILAIAYISCFICTIIYLVKNHKSILDFIIPILMIFNLLVILKFPFSACKRDLELRIYEKKRNEVIQLVQNNKLKTDSRGNARLPKKYKNISVSGEIVIYQNDENGVVIGFWNYRGMLSSYSIIVYSSKDEELIKEKIKDIIEIKTLKEHWYFIAAR